MIVIPSESVMQYGTRSAVAVEKVSEVHFKSTHQAVTLAKYLGKAREYGWNFTVTPHPSAPKSSSKPVERHIAKPKNIRELKMSYSNKTRKLSTSLTPAMEHE